jgi:hypothetical protein
MYLSGTPRPRSVTGEEAANIIEHTFDSQAFALFSSLDLAARGRPRRVGPLFRSR